MFIKSYPSTKSVTWILFIQKYLWLSIIFSIEYLYYILLNKSSSINLFKEKVTYTYYITWLWRIFLLNVKFDEFTLGLIENECALLQYTHIYHVRHNKDYIFYTRLISFWFSEKLINTRIQEKMTEKKGFHVHLNWTHVHYARLITLKTW